MPSASELLTRVTSAEAALTNGDLTEAFRQFSALAWMVADAAGREPFGHNESLVLHRCADIGILIGRIDDALDLYQTLSRRGAQREVRALAACKWLDLATQVGAGRSMKQATATIMDDVWTSPPPTAWTEHELSSWERSLGWDPEQRVDLFVAMYLAMGRMLNAARRLEESSRWLQRGLHHAAIAAIAASASARSTSWALRLALARNELSRGRLTASRAILDTLATETSNAGSAYVYRLGLLHGWAELTLVEGRFAELLRHLDEMEALARAHRMTRVVCQCLLSQAEVSIMLNLLPEAEARLREAEALAPRDAGSLQSLVRRARFLLASRMQGLALPYTGASAYELQNADSAETGHDDFNGAARPVTPRRDERGSLPPPIEEEVIWSGDCLRDYELREMMVYANLERRPDEARRDLLDLRDDFGGVDSPLVLARLHAITGLLESRDGATTEATPALEQALVLFGEMGAEREAYQATLFLARAVHDTNPERYARLLHENDARLLRLAEGLSTEHRNAFFATRFRSVEERQRVRIQELVRRRESIASAPVWRRIQKRLELWRDLHEFLCDLEDRQDLRQKTPIDTGTGTRRPRPRGFHGLLRRLFTHRWTNQTVGYVVLPDQAFMYETRWGWMDCRSLEVARLGVESLHRSLIGSPREDYEAHAAAVCEALGLQQTIDRLPSRIRSLTLVPDAGLHVVPFCALRYRRSNGTHAWLIERVAIAFDTVAMNARSPARESPPVAVVSYYTGTERPLPAAAAAAARAAKWLGGAGWHAADPLVEKSACLASLRRTAVFYYFGHGHFHRGDPDASGLDFSGQDGSDSQRLTLRDLDPIDCFNVEQAVVLACHGADAASYAGGWVISVPRMLLRRGARSVLGALWEAEMKIAAELSDRFFDLAARKGRAEALRLVQLDLLEKHPDPLWWAAFQVYGDSGRLRTPRARRPWPKRRAHSPS